MTEPRRIGKAMPSVWAWMLALGIVFVPMLVLTVLNLPKAFAPSQDMGRALQAYASEVSKVAWAFKFDTGRTRVSSDCANGYAAGKYTVSVPSEALRHLIASCVVGVDANGDPSVRLTTTNGEMRTHGR
jgi:hypothetical protein